MQSQEPQSDEEETGERFLDISPETRQILINLYASLLAIKWNKPDRVDDAFARNIANLMTDLPHDHYTHWSISDSGKRLKMYDYDGSPEDAGGLHIQDESLDKIRKYVLSNHRTKHPELVEWDLDWWSGLSDDDKMAIFTVDFEAYGDSFRNYKKDHNIEYNHEVTTHVQTHFPNFGNPDNPKYSHDPQTAPLPLELTKAISKYVINHFNDDYEGFAESIREKGNFNALVREAIDNDELK